MSRRFRLLPRFGRPDRPHSGVSIVEPEAGLQAAAETGWPPESVAMGTQKLLALAIGETCTDHDGDHWERIA